MSYAIRNDGKGWRAVNRPEDCAEDESYSEDAPALIQPSKEDRIVAIQNEYEKQRDTLNKAWLSAMIADGVNETARKDAIVLQMNDLDAQLETDIMAVIMEE